MTAFRKYLKSTSIWRR